MTKQDNIAVMQALTQRAFTHYQNNTTDQASGTMEMPVSAYTDGTQYLTERAAIFGKLPLALALSIEVPNPGDYKAVTVLEKPVIVCRDEQGQVNAFVNACRHRGARLCDDGADHCRVFTCPYHAWSYNLQGELVGRYAAETFGEITPGSRNLLPLPCVERCGLIWVTLDSEHPWDIDDWLGDFATELDRLQLADWHLFEQRDLPGPGWKVTMDGYLEVYHHNLVHRSTVGQYTVGNLLVHDTFGPHQRLTFGRKSLADLAAQAPETWSPTEHIRLIHSGFPNLSISGIVGDHALVSQILPGQSADQTITRQSILVANEPDDDASKQAAQTFSQMVYDAVMHEDYAIGQRIQQGIHSLNNTSFIFGRNEPAVQHYHQWVARLAKQHQDTGA